MPDPSEQPDGSAAPDLVLRLQSYDTHEAKGPLSKALLAGTVGFVLGTLGVRAVLLLPFLDWSPALEWGISAAVGALLFALLYDDKRDSYQRFFCKSCGGEVPIVERLVTLRVDVDDIRCPGDSAIVSALAAEDWSALQGAEQPDDWWADPAVHIGVGRCHGCRGTLILFGEVHGTDNSTKTLYMGTPFVIEISQESEDEFLAAVRDGGLVRHPDVLDAAQLADATDGPAAGR